MKVSVSSPLGAYFSALETSVALTAPFLFDHDAISPMDTEGHGYSDLKDVKELRSATQKLVRSVLRQASSGPDSCLQSSAATSTSLLSEIEQSMEAEELEQEREQVLISPPAGRSGP